MGIIAGDDLDAEGNAPGTGADVPGTNSDVSGAGGDVPGRGNWGMLAIGAQWSICGVPGVGGDVLGAVSCVAASEARVFDRIEGT